MSRTTISIPSALDQKIEELTKHGGFQSKAEFIRHAIQTYVGQSERSKTARKLGINLPLSAF